ncbi:MAG: ribosome maturation factor RimP [Lachnospiraceae bacterium]|nr:ribosome maturation factor RimP [Lachnospiraceae bacterium]
MSVREEYELRTEQLITPLVEKNSFELVDVEYVKEGANWYLRAYIDKEGGITVDDCEIVSRELSDLLDKEDFIPDAYILEVSSPGLGRQLKKEKDFKRSLGEEVEVKLYKGIELLNEKGKKVKVKEVFGYLEAYDKETITLDLGEEKLEITRKDIAIIRLAIHF